MYTYTDTSQMQIFYFLVNHNALSYRHIDTLSSFCLSPIFLSIGYALACLFAKVSGENRKNTQTNSFMFRILIFKRMSKDIVQRGSLALNLGILFYIE